MKTAKTRTLSSHAAAAKMIRAKLKTAYPSVRFSVVSESYAGGDAVRIGWTDGPTTDAVDRIAKPHQHGHFDGSIDMYESSNRRDDIPQAKYVQTQRRTTPEALAAGVALINFRYGWEIRIDGNGWIDRDSDKHTGHGWQSHEVLREIHKMSMVCAACNAPTLPGDAFCPDCGASLGEEAQAAAADTTTRAAADLAAYWAGSISGKGPRADITRV